MGKKIEYDYLPEDKFIIVNDDPDLIPIKIYLPKAPPLHLIDGYGLSPKDQKFKRETTPKKLIEIERNGGNPRSVDEIWNYIEAHSPELSDEIAWIKKQWYFRLNGYWFFNHGKPTYITGKHWYYLNWFRIDVGYPKYRDRDRKYWVFKNFCLNDTYDFRDKDENGKAVADEQGYYHFIDLGKRICFGDVYVKYRREGATYKAVCDEMETISKKTNAMGGIQSRNDKDARKVFQKKLVPAFKKIPFFFKPEYPSSTDPKKELVFDKQSSTEKKSIATVDTGLQSMIDYEVGDEGAYDGVKLVYKFDDEEGKNTLNDVWQRHLIAKECLSEEFGLKIVGYNSKASTAGEMEYGGGEQFKKECDLSNFYIRNNIGQTISGCYLLFISSVEGIDPDEFGNYDKVKNEETILGQRIGYLKQDPPDQVGWCEKVRQYPIYYRECFGTTSNSIGFNIQKLSKRMDGLRIDPKSAIRGNFVRENPADKLSRVQFVENKNGKFLVSLLLESEKTNRWFMRDGKIMPLNPKFTGGSDAFRMNNTEGQKQSKGGGSVFWNRDTEIDPMNKDIKDWVTHRFVCTYLYRPPTTDEYADDMLMMCQYYGALMNTETNVPVIVDKWTAWGFDGYLMYLINSEGTIRNTPGIHAGEESKQKLMLTMMNHIELHCHRERHYDLLEQCSKIPSIKKLNDYDLLAASGWALIGAENGYKEYCIQPEEEEDTYDPLNILNILSAKKIS